MCFHVLVDVTAKPWGPRNCDDQETTWLLGLIKHSLLFFSFTLLQKKSRTLLASTSPTPNFPTSWHWPVNPKEQQNKLYSPPLLRTGSSNVQHTWTQKHEYLATSNVLQGPQTAKLIDPFCQGTHVWSLLSRLAKPRPAYPCHCNPYRSSNGWRSLGKKSVCASAGLMGIKSLPRSKSQKDQLPVPVGGSWYKYTQLNVHRFIMCSTSINHY